VRGTLESGDSLSFFVGLTGRGQIHLGHVAHRVGGVFSDTDRTDFVVVVKIDPLVASRVLSGHTEVAEWVVKHGRALHVGATACEHSA